MRVRSTFIFYVDGIEVWRTDAGGVSQVDQHIVISDEIGRLAGQVKEQLLPDHTYIDYIRVYKN